MDKWISRIKERETEKFYLFIFFFGIGYSRHLNIGEVNNLFLFLFSFLTFIRDAVGFCGMFVDRKSVV